MEQSYNNLESPPLSTGSNRFLKSLLPYFDLILLKSSAPWCLFLCILIPFLVIPIGIGVSLNYQTNTLQPVPNVYETNYQRTVIDYEGSIQWDRAVVSKIINQLSQWIQPDTFSPELYTTCPCRYVSGQGYFANDSFGFLPVNLTTLINPTPGGWCWEVAEPQADTPEISQQYATLCHDFHIALTNATETSNFAFGNQLLRADELVKELLDRYFAICMNAVLRGVDAIKSSFHQGLLNQTYYTTLLKFWDTVLKASYMYCFDERSFRALFLEPPWSKTQPHLIYYDYHKDSRDSLGSEIPGGTTYYQYYVARCNPGFCVSMVETSSPMIAGAITLALVPILWMIWSWTIICFWSALSEWKACLSISKVCCWKKNSNRGESDSI